MNAAVLDFPPIEAPPLAVKPAPAAVAVVEPAPLLAVSIKDAVLAQFKEAETTVLALVEKYRAVAFDVSTTKGMNEAKAARLELREKGRFAVQRAEKSVKSDVNDLKRVMADEVERIVAIVMPVEESIDQQIKAEEDRKAAAKAERDRIEAERVAAHQAGIAKVRAYLARCQEPGMTAERIGKGIDLLTAVTFGPEWQEFATQAAAAQRETLEAMRALQGKAIEREVAAAKAEAERVEREAEQQRIAAENARMAAELAEQKRALAEQAATIAAQQKAIDDAKAEEATRLEREARQAEAKRIQAEGDSAAAMRTSLVAAEPNTPAQESPQVLKEKATQPDATDREAPAATSPSVDSMGAGQAVDAAPLQAPIAIDPVALLTNCQDALSEALLLIQELVTVHPGDAKASRAILARVAELRALGGI